MIRKEGSQYVLYSKDGSKVLGRGTKEEMLKREKEVNYFKQKKGDK
jgi:hypothetical protein